MFFSCKSLEGKKLLNKQQKRMHVLQS